MSLNLNVNSVEITRLSRRLQLMRTSLLPKAVRNTLNDVAFNAKRRVPQVAQGEFTIRNKSLFKAFILVNKTSAGDINSMQTEVGVFSSKNDKTAEGLSKHETGGESVRGLIPMSTARISGSQEKKVRTANYLSKITLPRTRQRGTGTGHVLIKKGNKGTLFATKGGKRGQKLKPLYSFMKNRRVQVKKKPFIKTAAEIEARQMNQIFIRNATFLLNRNR